MHVRPCAAFNLAALPLMLGQPPCCFHLPADLAQLRAFLWNGTIGFLHVLRPWLVFSCCSPYRCGKQLVLKIPEVAAEHSPGAAAFSPP